MKLSRSIETLHDLREFLDMVENAGIDDTASVYAVVRIGGRVKTVTVDSER